MSHRIVVVDDDKVTLELIGRSLAKAGHEVYTAANGELGFDLIKSVMPDLIISDMLIPKIHGIELVQKIRNEPLMKDIPFILISAVYKSLTFKRDIDESGADFFVQKPLDMPKLLSLVKDLLEKKDKDKE